MEILTKFLCKNIKTLTIITFRRFIEEFQTNIF